MYAFLVNNQNFIFNKKTKFNNINNHKFENIEVDMKKKINNAKNFNPDTCYKYSDVNDSDGSDDSKSNKKSLIKNKKDNDYSLFQSNDKKGNIIQSKIKTINKWIKFLDLTVLVIVLVGYLISQVENDDFFNTNSTNRKFYINIINFMMNYNLNNRTPPSNYIDLTDFGNLLRNVNSSSDDVIRVIKNYTAYSDIQINLEISTNGNIMRLILLITSFSVVPMIITSRFIEYQKEVLYKEKQETSFFSTQYFPFCIAEILLICLFQYPGLNTYLLEYELGNNIVLPYSTMLSAFTFFRFYFTLKILKHLTRWTNEESEAVCEKYVCKSDFFFAFKAYQKENPFLVLFIIFLITCVCFGTGLRSFELYYWETQYTQNQDWSYLWNAMWCIFVSMTTVGYGDFYPKTQVGRFIAIISCIIGVYFVSMMMVFMTQKSQFGSNEFKSYKLIARLKRRKAIKDLKSKMIFHAFQLFTYKEKLRMDPDDVELLKKVHFYKRNITTKIEEIKSETRALKSFEIIPTQEHLFDISERISVDIIEIKQHLESLTFINETLLSFTDSQIEISKYLKKNCYSTKLLYSIIEKKRVFGKLNNVDFSLKDEFELDVEKNDESNINKIENPLEKLNNPQDPGLVASEIEDISILNYNVTAEDIKTHFDCIFSKEKQSRKPSKNSRKDTNKTMAMLQQYRKTSQRIKNSIGRKKNTLSFGHGEV